MAAAEAKQYLQGYFQQQNLESALAQTQQQLADLIAAQSGLSSLLKAEVSEQDKHKVYEWESPHQGRVVLVIDWNAPDDVVLAVEMPELVPET